MPEDNALNTSPTWGPIAAAIGTATGQRFVPRKVADVGGGCITRAAKLSDPYRSFFVKLADAPSAGMFEAERDGLAALGASEAVRVPRPVAVGATQDCSFLVLEFVPLRRLGGSGWAELGGRLAALHRETTESFGWHRSNTIGSTPQSNRRASRWIDFWRVHRLGHQLDLAAGNGLDASTGRRGRELLGRLEELLADHNPVPSLVHGDLWSGNVAGDENGRPVLFDPAVYYGDREVDLAMSELFGGFDPGFYRAYQRSWPLDPGYEDRKVLYNLYHVLNHFNLFGGGYGGRARVMIDHLLAR